MSTEYLYLATRNPGTWPLRGSAQPFISQTDARNIRILVPSHNLAEIFGALVRPYFTKQLSNTEVSTTLAALRDTLLPKLLSGEIDKSVLEQVEVA